ncbi:MAG: hypothetical protein AAF902_06205 [Chloroflexota bacterium]
MYSKKQLNPLKNEMFARIRESDLKNVCFELGIDFEDLEGKITKDRIMSLIDLLNREERILELLEILEKVFKLDGKPWSKFVPAVTYSDLKSQNNHSLRHKNSKHYEMAIDLYDSIFKRLGAILHWSINAALLLALSVAFYTQYYYFSDQDSILYTMLAVLMVPAIYALAWGWIGSKIPNIATEKRFYHLSVADRKIVKSIIREFDFGWINKPFVILMLNTHLWENLKKKK